MKPNVHTAMLPVCRMVVVTLVVALITAMVAGCGASTTTISQLDRAAADDPGSEAEPTPATDSGDPDSGDAADAGDPAPGDDPAPDDQADDDQADDDQAGDDQAGDDQAGDSGPEPTAPAADSAAGDTTVVLLDAGAEPRTELRLMIAPSCGEITTFTQVQEVFQSLDGATTPSAGPIGNVIEMATSATPNGDDYDVRAEVISAAAAPDTPPAVAAGLDAQLASLVGLTTVTTMTDRGVQLPGTTRVEGGEALGPLRETVEAVAQTQSPLPVEAVGVGARWETVGVVDVQGLMVTTTTTTEVVAIEGTIVDLTVTGTQDVAIGSIMRVQGTSAEVTEWTSTTTGSITLDLATISPISSTAVTEASQGFLFDDGLGGGNLEQQIQSEITIVGKPDAGCTGRSTQP